jgi:hypothetical protein
MGAAEGGGGRVRWVAGDGGVIWIGGGAMNPEERAACPGVAPAAGLG